MAFHLLCDAIPFCYGACRGIGDAPSPARPTGGSAPRNRRSGHRLNRRKPTNLGRIRRMGSASPGLHDRPGWIEPSRGGIDYLSCRFVRLAVVRRQSAVKEGHPVLFQGVGRRLLRQFMQPKTLLNEVT